jgi:hypothetical protein
MIVSAHQPHYFPWIGYFNKIHLSDVFMLMDNMNYTKNSFIGRNRIVNSKGLQYISVPLIKPNGLNTKINELIIDNKTRANWNIKNLRAIKHNYYKGIGFNDFFPIIESILSKKHEFYINLSNEIIFSILKYLDINTKIILASNTNTIGNKEDELIVKILDDSGCKSMLLGLGASLSYVNKNYINSSGYSLICQNFEHPIYGQNTKNFQKGVSIIDLILNLSQKDAIETVKNAGNTKLCE